MAKDNISPSERRVYPRKTLRTKVVFEDENGEGFIYFYSTDVSEGGIFFEHDVPLQKGTRVFLSFRLPDQQLIRATGEIVRQANIPQAASSKGQNTGMIVGMGLSFTDLVPEYQKTLRQFTTES